jgi:hypothetical protein
MKNPKIYGVLVLTFCSGCAVFTQPPRPDAAEIQSEVKANAQKSGWVRSRQKDYEAKGMTSDAARQLAEHDYRDTPEGREALLHRFP